MIYFHDHTDLKVYVETVDMVDCRCSACSVE